MSKFWNNVNNRNLIRMHQLICVIHLPYLEYMPAYSELHKTYRINALNACLVQVLLTWICYPLTHWGRVTHICVSKQTSIGSNNGLSPERRQAIIWVNAGILLIRTLGTNFSEILSEIHAFSFKKMQLKVSSAKWRPFCLGLDVLMNLHNTNGSSMCYHSY